jgi:hypothetical protein
MGKEAIPEAMKSLADFRPERVGVPEILPTPLCSCCRVKRLG